MVKFSLEIKDFRLASIASRRALAVAGQSPRATRVGQRVALLREPRNHYDLSRGGHMHNF